MTEHGVVAHLPVLPMRVGMSITMSISGAGAAIAVVAMANRPVVSLALTLSFAGVFFGMKRFTQSDREVRHRESLEHASRPPAYLRRAALVRGILVTACGVAAVVPIFELPYWASGMADPPVVLSSLLLGFGLAEALSVRDLRRWQDRNGLEVFTNAAGPRFGFTPRQALRSQVLVQGPDVIRSAQPQDSAA